MEALFASSDIIGAIGQAMATIGLKTNNVADAYAVYWVAAWQASRGDMSDASALTCPPTCYQSEIESSC
jgi:hypothetical protein